MTKHILSIRYYMAKIMIYPKEPLPIEVLDEMVEQWIMARKEKNWPRADCLRQRLYNNGIYPEEIHYV